jgi:hypothetical protein
MSDDRTYKVKMNLGADEFACDVPANEYVDRMMDEQIRELGAGWTWIGNPYQYNQDINHVFNSQFAAGDVVKMKKQFATFDGTQWQPAITVEPGQGMILYKKEAGELTFASEFDLGQNLETQAPARSASPSLWKIDDSRFDDNMAMVAYVGAVDDASRLTLWAFVGDECRGRSVNVGDLQFITVHGQQGERVTFKVYDETTGQLRQVIGSRPFAAISGSVKEPVSLYAGPVLTSIDDVNIEAINADGMTFDLQGRRVSNATKGLYIQNGRKVVVK